MALSQKDTDALVAAVEARMRDGFKAFVAKADEVGARVDAAAERVMNALGQVPEGTRKGLAADFARAIADGNAMLQASLPAGVVLAFKEAAPVLMDGVHPEQGDPGPVCKRHWIVDETFTAMMPGHGSLSLEKGRILDEACFNVRELVRQRKPLRKMYASELAKYHIEEEE